MPALTLTPEALQGSWVLEWAHVLDGDAVVDATPFGPDPVGMLHYLPDGRMAALIAHATRARFAHGRAGATDAERLAAARSFIAYGGRYEVLPDRVVHHVDMNSYPNEAGTDYVRFAVLEGDTLELKTPVDVDDGQRPMHLRWRRLGS